MTKSGIDQEALKNVSGGMFPDGEFPHGVLVCPTCGEPSENLELLSEQKLDIQGSAVHALVTDHMYRSYRCKNCGKEFWHYGDFYEFIH